MCSLSVETYIIVYPFMSTHRRQALLCVLAKDCNEAGYVRLVEALCNEHQIKLLKASLAIAYPACATLLYSKPRLPWVVSRDILGPLFIRNIAYHGHANIAISWPFKLILCMGNL